MLLYNPAEKNQIEEKEREFDLALKSLGYDKETRVAYARIVLIEELKSLLFSGLLGIGHYSNYKPTKEDDRITKVIRTADIQREVLNGRRLSKSEIEAFGNHGLGLDMI